MYCRAITLLVAIVSILSCAAASQAQPISADFFVAPWGDDTAPGTLAEPFASVTRARDAVRPLIAAGLTGDITVLLRGGTYPIITPIIFGLADAATPPYAVSYAAYPGERPRISGGRAISGWIAQPDGTWAVTLPDVASGAWTFRELFVNNQRAQRARHPNTGFLLVAGPDPAAPADTRLSFAFDAGDIPTQTNLSGAELVFLHDWNTTRVRVDHVDHALNILTLTEPVGPSPAFSVFGQQQHPRYAVENDRALLDAPGEWYLDEASGQLTYLPLPGEDLLTAEAIAPIADALLLVRGDEATEQFVTNLKFDGIAFEHCAWQLPGGGYAEWQAGFYDWRDYPAPYEFPAAVTFELADGCAFVKGRLAHLGGWGIMMGRSCRNCVCVGNLVTDIAGNGIMVGEDPFRSTEGQEWWLSRPDQAASGNVVRNNLVQACGVVLHGCVGIWLGIANDTDISHNLIRSLPQIGISVGWIWDDTPSPCWGNTIEYNHIHDVMRMLSDGGGIYTLGRQPGTVLHGNLIHDIPPNVGVNESNGIFCDQGTTDVLLDGNTIFNIGRSPARFHASGFNLVSNNTLVLDDPGTQSIGYVATDPADINLIDNNVRVSLTTLGCDDPAYAGASLAGLEPGYRTLLLGDADTLPVANECLCLSCRGDMDGSSIIDAGDIDEFVTALIDGSNNACADVNVDGITDARDIQRFTEEVIAQAPCPVPSTGACCTVNGSCSQATESDCLAAAGAYQGDGTSCQPGFCPQPVGLCCLCEQCEQFDEIACVTQGGTFFRLVASCQDIGPCPMPPLGACCLPNETCDVRTECSCLGLGGTYLGDATDCSAGTPALYLASPGLPIDGSQTVTHTINVRHAFVVGDVNIQLDLPHTWVGDLRITVEHLGTTVSLVDTILYSGCGEDLVTITLDDEGAGGPVQEQCGFEPWDVFPSSPPNFTPNEPLRVFDGMTAAGDWTISITDVFPAADNGTLDAWRLSIDMPGGTVCAPVP